MAVSLNRIASAIAMDRWEEIGENTNIWNPDQATTTVNIDPLYIVCSQLRKVPIMPSEELFTILQTILDNQDAIDRWDTDITPEDMMLAKQIRQHFRNKLMMRRLKDQKISGFMQTVDTILDNDQSYNTEMIPVLIKLPGFYEEDIKTSEIFSKAVNPKKINKMRVVNVDEDLFSIGSVTRDSRTQKIETFYFLNRNKTLFAASCKSNSVESRAWHYICGKQKIHVTGTARKAAKPGQEVYYFELQRDIQIKD